MPASLGRRCGCEPRPKRHALAPHPRDAGREWTPPPQSPTAGFGSGCTNPAVWVPVLRSRRHRFNNTSCIVNQPRMEPLLRKRSCCTSTGRPFLLFVSPRYRRLRLATCSRGVECSWVIDRASSASGNKLQCPQRLANAPLPSAKSTASALEAQASVQWRKGEIYTRQHTFQSPGRFHPEISSPYD